MPKFMETGWLKGHVIRKAVGFEPTGGMVVGTSEPPALASPFAQDVTADSGRSSSP